MFGQTDTLVNTTFFILCKHWINVPNNVYLAAAALISKEAVELYKKVQSVML